MTGHIHTPTPNLEQSVDFYARLGFSVALKGSPSFITDGDLIIEHDAERTARAGVSLYGRNWGEVIPKLDTPTHTCKGGHVCADPNGVWVYLLDGHAPEFDRSKSKGSVLGKCIDVTLETTDMVRSAAFWQALDFAITMGTTEIGWVVVSAEGCPGISIMKPLMCPTLFYNPSLTYFNGKEGNPVVIENMRKAGIPITEEITHFNTEGIEENIIIRDPGGYGFFLFNDRVCKFV